MKLTLTNDELNAYCSELHESNAVFKSEYPADSFERQPVHTVYGCLLYTSPSPRD